MGMVLVKPTFDRDQLVSSKDASKRFGAVAKRAKERPQYITKDGKMDTVLIGYDLFEEMYERLMKLEREEEVRVLLSRMERLDRDPSQAVPWKSVRRNNS